MELRFDGLTIIVTGGGTGIGRAIAQGFAAGGGSVIVNYRKSEREAQQTVSEIEHAGGQAKAVQADVTQWEDVTRMIDEARETFGSIDILVNNAGGNIEKHPIAEYPPDIWERTVALNLSNVFLCCKAAIPVLPKQTGRIINITSISAVTGGGMGGAAYGAAKAGVITLTRNLAHELAPRGITVNAVAPGVIDTRIHQQFTSAKDYETLIGRIPLGRDGKPADIAGITLLLASEHGSYITGQTVHVNGGMLMI